VLYKGYCTDFGRSVFVGEPNPEALRAYESIIKGSRGVVEKMGDGKMSHRTQNLEAGRILRTHRRRGRGRR